MSATYQEITETEMRNFLESQGSDKNGKPFFRQVQVPGTKEMVFGRAYGKNLTLRVYTSIENGVSREVGGDAIRVTIFYRDAEGNIYKVGGSKRVHRVKNWRINLQKRLDNWKDSLNPTPCPCCGAPMRVQTVKNKTSQSFGKHFLSCVTWRKTKCDGSVWDEQKVNAKFASTQKSKVA